MKQSTVKLITIILFLLASCYGFSQDVTINYQTWNPSSPPCDVFATSNNVPATINGSAGTIAHVTMLGDVQYNTSSLKALQLDNSYANASSNKGTKFRLAYNFKSGYRYTITVTSTELNSTAGMSNGPYLRIDLSNSTAGGGNTVCLGPETVTSPGGANPAPWQYSNTTFTDVVFNYAPLGAGVTYSMLELTAIPGQVDGSTNSVLIRKITITETPPNPTFAISPSSVSKPCGESLSQTFTANGTNIPNGATVSHVWNLGSATNGWLYNGTAAPQTITTSANTLTLTATDCGAIPSNVSLTGAVNGTNYSGGTSIISAPAFSISGAPSFCSGSQTYSIANLGCGGATVSWSVSPANVVTPSSGTGSSFTINKVNNGSVTISATIANACGIATTQKSKTVSVGALPPTFTVTPLDGTTHCANQRFEALSTSYGTGTTVSYNWYINGSLQSGHGYKIRSAFPSNNTTIGLTVSNTTCGTTDIVTQSFSCESGFAMSPNPGRGSVAIKTTASTIREVRITDKTGAVRRTLKYSSAMPNVQVDLSSLPADVYNVSVFDGKQWQSQKLTVVK